MNRTMVWWNYFYPIHDSDGVLLGYPVRFHEDVLSNG